MKTLVFDIGNTNTVIALHDGSSWVFNERVKTKDNDMTWQIWLLVRDLKADKAVISSVVPSLTNRVCDIAKSITNNEVLIISNRINTGLDNPSIPEECGSDIICNLIAAHHYFPDKYVTVADFGTAFTTETVSPLGKVLGVTIAPGMMTSVKALFENTAQIPQIRLDLPNTVLGRDTVSSIRAGVLYGFPGQLNAILERIEQELDSKVFLIATGGFAKFIKPYVDRVDLVDINFTIEGARLACMMN